MTVFLGVLKKEKSSFLFKIENLSLQPEKQRLPSLVFLSRLILKR
tara:strand:+ start:318811 stop:318945 length:135 start_codon:yes stop_codon:yes gene_type:complete